MAVPSSHTGLCPLHVHVPVGWKVKGCNVRAVRIGELAEEVSLPAKTICYYEEIGLLPPAERRANGYRD